MQNVNYQNIIEVTLNSFPEFKESKQFKEIMEEVDISLPYIFFGYFNEFIIDHLTSEKHRGSPIIQRFVIFVNELFADTNSDPKVLNLIQIEIFELLAESKELIEFARKNLVGKALDTFEFTSRHYGVEASVSSQAQVEPSLNVK